MQPVGDAGDRQGEGSYRTSKEEGGELDDWIRERREGVHFGLLFFVGACFQYGPASIPVQQSRLATLSHRSHVVGVPGLQITSDTV